MSSREDAMDLLLLGMSHRTADLATRESLAFSPEEATALLRELTAREELLEVAVLSTCNRTELYAVTHDATVAEAALREAVGRRRGQNALCDGPMRYRHLREEAALHLHRVAAGLDSLVLGEKQVLGQVKDAWCLARGAGSLGPLLDKLFASAVHAGKRARTETEIDAGAVSVASAAVALAGKVFGELEGRDVVVVGAGDTGRLAARHFAERRPRRLRVLNRTPERAVALAAEVSGEPGSLDGLPGALVEADVVALATRAPQPLLAAEAVAAALRQRPRRPLVLLDLAVPRDVEPEAAALENVFLYPVDALRGLVEQSMERRQREAPRAAKIAAEECERFLAWWRGLGATPVLRELREHFERVRSEELARSLRHFSPGEQEHVERLTRALVNKLLHLPTTRLKSLDLRSRDGLARLDTVRELFALGEAGPGGEVDRGA
jgi:glutamyl-tRNA reductase